MIIIEIITITSKGYFMKKQALIAAAVFLTGSLSIQGMLLPAMLKRTPRTTRQIQRRPYYQAKTPKMYNINDIGAKIENIISMHGNKYDWLMDMSLLKFDNPNQAIDFLHHIDMYERGEKVKSMSQSEFISHSRKEQQKE